MWNLVVYELIPWDGLIRIAKLGKFSDLDDCLYFYSYAVQEISKADLIGTYIPMCSKVLP